MELKTAEQLYEKGHVFIEQGDYGKAIEAFSQAISLEPDNMLIL
ncbi:hypothetical protein FACS189442_5060 [Spirochaetia bacterium]|nr:hypothetical protein FACS189442_5060 [Spirochaetia bacterium]